jgi:hypothetical protein
MEIFCPYNAFDSEDEHQCFVGILVGCYVSDRTTNVDMSLPRGRCAEIAATAISLMDTYVPNMSL